MDTYAQGNGHKELAQQLNIPTAISLAKPGSCNSRIIRTCLKDSYAAHEPTLYIVGLSFLSRSEIPVHFNNDSFEGKWIGVQNHVNPKHQYESHWTHNDTQTLLDLTLKLQLASTKDRFENLIYNLLSCVDSICKRGHEIVVYRQVNDVDQDSLDQVTAIEYCSTKNFVQGLLWHAVPWQFNNGVKWKENDELLPIDVRHPKIGDHTVLNNFLFDYISNNVSV
jgi:hypothetical protein